MKFKFDLGDEVVDIVTGYKGIVRAHGETMTQVPNYGVQSSELDDNGDIKKWKWMDENIIELSEAGKVTPPAAEREFMFEIGDKVKDQLSGKKGIIFDRTSYMTGCNIYGVVPAKKIDDDVDHVPEGRLKMIKKRKVDVHQKMQAPQEEQWGVKTEDGEDEPQTTGGPHSSDEFQPGTTERG